MGGGAVEGPTLYCYLTIVVCQCINVMMHVTCLYTCDTVFRYTLEKNRLFLYWL